MLIRRQEHFRYSLPPAKVWQEGRAAKGAFSAKLPQSFDVTVTRIPPSRLPVRLQDLVLDQPRRVTDLVAALSDAYGPADREWFLVLLLDSRLRFWGWATVAIGGWTSVQVEPPMVFHPVVAAGKPNFMLVHNHPSGDPTPSGEDHVLTAQIREGANLLGLNLLDHLIIGGKQYTSFAEQRLL